MHEASAVYVAPPSEYVPVGQRYWVADVVPERQYEPAAHANCVADDDPALQ